MSLAESVKDKLSAQIQLWEKQLDQQQAKLKSDVADAENQQANSNVREEARKAIENNIELLQHKIDEAKDKLTDAVSS